MEQKRGKLFGYSYTNCQREETARDSGYYLKLRLLEKKRLHAAVKVADVPLVLILLLFTCMGASTVGDGGPTTGLQGARSCGRVNINTAHKKSVWHIEMQKIGFCKNICFA